MKMSLDLLPLNNDGHIIKMNVNNNIKRRLMDLGLVNNTVIRPLYRSPLKDPTAYLTRGTIIALRKDDSKNIIVEKDDINGIN